MKTLKYMSMFLLGSCILFSCCGLNKMVKKQDLVSYSVNPDPVEVYAGKMPVEIKGTFPPKYFKKKAVVTFTPTIQTEDGNTVALTPITLKGEKAPGEGKVISYKNGGTFTVNQEIQFQPGYETSMMVGKPSVQLKAKQAEFQKTIANLEKNYRVINNVIAKLDRDSEVYKNYITKLQNERAAADREIDEIIRKAAEEAARKKAEEEARLAAQQGGTTTQTVEPAPSGGGSWGYPVGGSTYISSGYGNRSASISGWSFHGGIDIAGGGIYGRPVYASRGGTVIAAVWSNSGYGNYVIIDHGDGYASLYGHCSSLAVSTGQTVSKGQHIANVGSTGNSTGPHLHFEIRKNGVKVNPANYL